MAHEVKPRVSANGEHRYFFGADVNNGETIIVSERDPLVREMDSLINSRITPGMSSQEKTQVIREVVNDKLTGSNSSDVAKVINSRDRNHDGRVTTSESDGNAVCVDMVSNTDYFMRKHDVDSHIVVSATSWNDIDHTYLVSEGKAVETTNNDEPTYMDAGKKTYGDDAKSRVTVNYVIPPHLQQSADRDQTRSIAVNRPVEQPSLPVNSPASQRPAPDARMAAATLPREVLMSAAEAGRIAFGLNDGQAGNDKKVAAELGINLKDGAYFDNDLSQAIQKMSRKGLDANDMAKIKEMVTADKDGDGKADHVLDSTKGDNYKQQISLNDIQIPHANVAQAKTDTVERK